MFWCSGALVAGTRAPDVVLSEQLFQNVLWCSGALVALARASEVDLPGKVFDKHDVLRRCSFYTALVRDEQGSSVSGHTKNERARVDPFTHAWKSAKTSKEKSLHTAVALYSNRCTHKTNKLQVESDPAQAEFRPVIRDPCSHSCKRKLINQVRWSCLVHESVLFSV